jgi:hypothetical protein
MIDGEREPLNSPSPMTTKDPSPVMMKLLPVLCGALITISISISSWTMKEVVDLRTKVTSLEATHVGPTAVLEIWKAIDALKEKVAGMPQTPPQWFVDQVNKMESRLDGKIEKIEKKIDDLNKR